MIRRPSLFIIGALATATVVASASAQTASSDRREKFLKTVQFYGDQAALQQQSIFAVPANKNFRVTDLIATNGSYDGTCLVYFSGKTAEMNVPPLSTKSFTFASGPTYGGGEQVYLGNDARIGGASANCSLTYTVMGYLFERP